jgi:hypothetical protein
LWSPIRKNWPGRDNDLAFSGERLPERSEEGRSSVCNALLGTDCETPLTSWAAVVVAAAVSGLSAAD